MNYQVLRTVLNRSLSPPLDGVNATLTGAWSMSRRMRSAYGGALFTEVSGGVSALLDQGGNARDFVQGTAGARPLVATDGIKFRTCANFDGTDDFLVSTGVATSTFITASTGYVVASAMADVIATDVAPVLVRTNDWIWGNQARLGGVALRSTGPVAIGWSFDANEDSTTGIAIATGKVHVFEWRKEGGNLFLRIDGGTETSVAAGDFVAAEFADPLKIGGEAITPNFHDIKFFEMATFSTIPVSADRDRIVANMLAWVS
jgi:hypothetical protein